MKDLFFLRRSSVPTGCARDAQLELSALHPSADRTEWWLEEIRELRWRLDFGFDLLMWLDGDL